MPIDEMNAAEYVAKYFDGIIRDRQSALDAGILHEMSAEEYQKTHGRTANDYLRNLDSSKANTENPAKVAFRDWLYAVSPELVKEEYRFSTDRMFRADWAIPSLGIIFEYDGRIHHGTVAGSERDAEKSNLAQLAGWLFMRVNATTINDGSAFTVAERAIELRRGKMRRDAS